MEFGVWDPLPIGRSFPEPQNVRKLRQESAEEELRSLQHCSGALVMLCARSKPSSVTVGHKTPLDGDETSKTAALWLLDSSEPPWLVVWGWDFVA